jgi:PAS domain S-box-containing protein
MSTDNSPLSNRPPVTKFDSFQAQIDYLQEQLNASKKREAALMRRNQLLEQAERLAKVGFWWWDIEKGEMYWSKQVYELYELVPGQLQPNLALALTFAAPEYKRMVSEVFINTLEKGSDWDAKYEVITAKGKRVWLHGLGKPEIKEGKVVKIIGTVQDISELKKTELLAKENENRYKLVARATTDVIWDWDLKTGKLWWSEGVETVFGYKLDGHVTGLDWWLEKVHPDERQVAESSLMQAIERRKEHWNAEYRFLRADATYIYIVEHGQALYENGKPVRMLGGMRDVSESRRLEEQLRQAQKIEAIGRLTGGIAHDFNNIITIIYSYTAFLLADFDETHSAYDTVRGIQTATERAAGLTQQLLAFSRKQVLDPKVIRINTVIQEIEKMLRRLLGEDIELVTNLAKGLGKVLIDPSQLEQVILNLAVNARDAMPTGGRLTIETANVFFEEDSLLQEQEQISGAYVLISVTDTGIGMDAETKARIFEPFFTTKEIGKGTGLGLATVHGIVYQSAGHIWVYSEPGVGTSFKIYLPQARGEIAQTDQLKPQVLFSANSCKVLLVEDEKPLRDIVGRVLRDNGFQVWEASNGVQALEMLNHLESIDLLLTDYVMPGGYTGQQLAVKVREKYPTIKILFVSGYADRTIIQQDLAEENTAFLQKPFTPNSLLRKVKEILQD